jgi:predicted nucleic acid-binding Zn ribbon protein
MIQGESNIDFSLLNFEHVWVREGRIWDLQMQGDIKSPKKMTLILESEPRVFYEDRYLSWLKTKFGIEEISLEKSGSGHGVLTLMVSKEFQDVLENKTREIRDTERQITRKTRIGWFLVATALLTWLRRPRGAF